MNRMQKIAWLLVITISLAVLFSCISVGILYVKFGFPKASAGLGFLGIAGLGGLGPLIFKKDQDAITCDERDTIINRRACLVGFSGSYLIMGLACMLPFFVLGPKQFISITWLPMIFTAGGLSCFFLHSVAVLIQYGRGGKNNE